MPKHLSRIALKPPGKKPKGRSGNTDKGVTCECWPPTGQGTHLRNSIAQGQTPPTSDRPINQKKQQAGVS